MNPIQETTDVSRIFKELDKTVKVVGASTLIEILKHLQKNPITLTEEQITKSLQLMCIICDEFNITIEELHGKKRENNRRCSLGIIAFFLEKQLQLDNSNISYILKKPAPLITLYKGDIVRLNPSHPSDMKILKKIENITLTINNLPQ